MREQHSKTNVYDCEYTRAEVPRSVVLAVKRCLGVFFMVFEVGLKLLVLLKASVFRLILRLHICDAAWSRLLVVSFLHFIHGSMEVS